MSREVEVRVSGLKNASVQMRVKLSDPVEVVMALFCCNTMRIFFKNCLLIPSFSFAFYKIEDGDELYCMVPPSKGQSMQSSRHKATFCEEIENSYKMAMGFRKESDFGVVLESSRIKDYLFMKIEGNLPYHRRLISKFKEIDEKQKTETKGAEDKQLQEKPEPTVWEGSLRGPSTEGLPIFWPSSSC